MDLNALDRPQDWSGKMTSMETTASETGSRLFHLGHLDLETYHRLGEKGVFEGLRVELIDGEVVKMSPMGPDHSDALAYLNRYLVKLDLPGILVRGQTPVPMADDTEPQPDFTVCREPLKGQQVHENPAGALVESARVLGCPWTDGHALNGLVVRWVASDVARPPGGHGAPQRVDHRQRGQEPSPRALRCTWR